MARKKANPKRVETGRPWVSVVTRQPPLLEWITVYDEQGKADCYIGVRNGACLARVSADARRIWLKLDDGINPRWIAEGAKAQCGVVMEGDSWEDVSNAKRAATAYLRTWLRRMGLEVTK